VNADQSRLDQQIAFLTEADKLKSVIRATTLCDGSRQENSAEHSWHIALYALILSEHAVTPVDVNRALKMLLLHDLVEIDAGDTPIHGDVDEAAQWRAEQNAADRLFGLLPKEQSVELRAIWEEFEAAETDDAIFAKAVDRVQPVISNLETNGGTWPVYNVTQDQLERRVGQKVSKGAPLLWRHLQSRISKWFDAKR
jgi:putative hydrolases of HD superfamily